VLNVTSASPLALNKNDPSTLLASLSKNARGAPVFDRKGGLVAIIAQSAGESKLVAGIAPTAVHAMIGVGQIQRFLSLTPDSASRSAGDALLGAGQIAAAERGNVVAISCRR
jgi:hypothetical protein